MDQENEIYRGKLGNNSRVSAKKKKKLVTDLKEQFPDLENCVIEDILESVDWDVNRAIEQLSDVGPQPIDTIDEFLQYQGATALPTQDESVTSAVQNNCYNPTFYNELVGSVGSRVNTLKLNSTNLVMEQWIEELDRDETNVDKVGVPKNRFSNGTLSLPTSPLNSFLVRTVKNKKTSFDICDASDLNIILQQQQQEQQRIIEKEENYSIPNRLLRRHTLYDAIKASSCNIGQSDRHSPISQELNNNHKSKPTNYASKVNGDERGINGHQLPENGVASGVWLPNGDLPKNSETDDYFDLQLTPNFVAKIFAEYSNPFGSLDIGELDLNVRIPPSLAFDLYTIFCLHLKKKFDGGPGVRDDEECVSSNPSSNGIDDDYTEEQLQDIIRMSEVTSDSAPDFSKIMEYEKKLDEHEEKRMQYQRSKVQPSLATKLALDELRRAFPTLPPQEIERYYGAYNSKYDETLRALKTTYGSQFVSDGLTDKFRSDQQVGSELTTQRAMEVLQSHEASKNGDRGGQQDYYDQMTAEELRELASEHYGLKLEYQQKINTAKRDSSAALHYTEMYRRHDAKMREANKKAAEKILEMNNGPNESKDKLDLHYLHATEAVTETQKYLTERTKYMQENNLPSLTVRIITGKGKNSNSNSPRLGPAIKKFLTSSRYHVVEQQGYMEVTLTPNQTMQKVGGIFG